VTHSALGMAMVNHSGLGPIAALASVVKTTSHRRAWCTMVVLFAVAGLEKKGLETNLHQATVAGTTTPPPDEPRYQHPIQPQQFETPSLVAATMVAPMVFGGICSNLDLELQALRLLTSLALSEVVVIGLKHVARRPRPNSVALWKAGSIESRLSWPSGHSSFAAAGCVSSAISVGAVPAGLPSAFSGLSRHYTMRPMAMLPLALAGWVGVTRVQDHWHHETDVMTGLAIGVLSALVAAATITAATGGPGGGAASGGAWAMVMERIRSR